MIARLWRRVFHNECEKALDVALDTFEEFVVASEANVVVMNKAADEIDRLNTENTALRMALFDLVAAVEDYAPESCLYNPACIAAQKLLDENKEKT